MKIYVPEYYNHFKCIAEKCRDNCCIGWGIDIDESSLEKYKNLKNPEGERILSTIDFSDGASFITDGQGRCKNLDERGLCRIISALGEDYLCQICRDHPRYFNCEFGRCEGGLGLACEEAARMIFSLDHLPEIVEIEGEEMGYLWDDEPCDFAFSARDILLEVAFDEGLSAAKKIKRLMGLAYHIDELIFDINCGIREDSATADEVLKEAPENSLDVGDFVDVEDFIAESLGIFHGLDLLSEDFGTLLIAAITAARENPAEFLAFLDAAGKSYFSRLLYYFIHRYFLSAEGQPRDNMRLASSLALATAAMIFHSEGQDLISAATTAKDFSKNIEYSTENISTLLEKNEKMQIM